MKNLEDYKEAGKELYHRLHLSTYPVSIKYIKDISEIPEGAIRPSAQGQQWSLCQAIAYARQWGWNVAMTSEDNFCVPSSASHRWEDLPVEDLIESQVRQGWHKDLEAEKRRSEAFISFVGRENIKRMAGYKGFICSPLPETIVIPDSVLVYGNGAQLTHIIHSLSYEMKHSPSSFFEGFGESCIKGGLIPFITQIPQIVIPGMGDRSFSGVSDHEIAIGVPASLLFYVLENLFKAGGIMNMGLPVKNLLPMNLTESITPGFTFLRERIEEYKEKKKG